MMRPSLFVLMACMAPMQFATAGTSLSDIIEVTVHKQILQTPPVDTGWLPNHWSPAAVRFEANNHGTLYLE